MNPTDDHGRWAGRDDIDEVDADMAADLIRAFGANSDGDDELYLPGELDDAAIARLDEVFQAAAMLQAMPKRRGKVPVQAKPGMRVGSIKAVDFESDEWLIEDIDSGDELRMARGIIPARLWDSMEEGELIGFQLEMRLAPKGDDSGSIAFAVRPRRRDRK